MPRCSASRVRRGLPVEPTSGSPREVCHEGDLLGRQASVRIEGAGPVGLFALASAYLLGAGWVIAIDRFPYLST